LEGSLAAGKVGSSLLQARNTGELPFALDLVFGACRPRLVFQPAPARGRGPVQRQRQSLD
jgi:hypothetical protein